jgi:hypothetical protein
VSVAAAEPFMPAEGFELLDNLAFDLAREASALSGQIHPVDQRCRRLHGDLPSRLSDTRRSWSEVGELASRSH